MRKHSLLLLLAIPSLLVAGCSNGVIKVKTSSSFSTSISYDFLMYTISVIKNENCTVNILSSSKSGQTINAEVIPSIQNYELRSVKIKEITHSYYIEPSITNNSFSFTMPNGNVEIEVIATIIDPLPLYQKTEIEKEMEEKGYSSLIEDSLFKEGFRVRKSMNNDDYIFKNPIDTYSWGKDPKWHITQWMTDYEINPDKNEYTLTKDGTKNKINSGPYDDQYAKALSFDSSTGEFKLECNAEYEYKNGTRIPYSKTYGNYWWVHFLIEQEFINPLKVSECSSIVCKLEYTVTSFERLKDFFENLAQFGWYITLQNKNIESDNYDTYIWFGFNIFNNKDVGKSDPGYYSFEHGSNVGIYRPSSGDVFKKGVMPDVGEKITIELEILDYLKAAYSLPMFKSFWGVTQWEDLYLGATNFGFEVASSSNISADISYLDIFYKKNID